MSLTFELHSEPCPCGKGKLTVTEYESEKMWSPQSSFKGSVDCATCSSVYRLEAQDGRYVLLRHADVHAAEKFSHELYKMREKVLASPDVAALKTELAARMDAQKFKSKKYSVVKSLTYDSEQTFVRKFSGSENWVRSNVRFDHLRKVMKLLNRQPPALVSAIEEIEELAKTAPVVEEVKSVYKLN